MKFSRWVPVLLSLGALALSGSASAAKLWEADFIHKGIEQFKIEDINVNVDPDYFEAPSGGPSAWKVANGVLNQSSNIYGNPDPCCQADPVPRYEDTYTGTAATAKDFSAQDGLFYMQFKTSDDDGTGLVFRYQNEKNYLRFYSMIDPGNGGPVTRIEKWVDGKMTILSILPDTNNGQDVSEAVVFKQNVRETMLCSAKGQDIACYLGDLNTPLLTAKDSDPKPGSFGVSLYANQLDVTTLTALSPDSSLFIATLNNTANAPINDLWTSLLKDGKAVDGGFTNPAGQVVFLDQAPGPYQITTGGLTVQPVAPQNLTINAGVGSGTFTFDVKPTATVKDLSTAAGAAWKIKVPAEPTEDFKAPDASEADFLDYEAPSDWINVDPDAHNAYAWLRVHVTVPAEYVGKDLVLADWNLDDEDRTYWNGALIGATAGDAILRRYFIPGANVKADNVLAIRGFNGAGPGGITTAAPKLIAANPSLSVHGTVKDPTDKPLEGVQVDVFSGSTQWGPQSGSATTDADGNYTIGGLAPGSYGVTRPARLDLDPADPQTATVTGEAGQTLEAPFVVSRRPSVVLSTANGFQWTINYATDQGDDFTAVNADTTNFVEIPVPSALEDSGLGQDFNYYWYRLKFTLPDAMKAAQGTDLQLTDFVVADMDITYLNGQKIGQTGELPTDPADWEGSGGVLDWTTIRDYTIPSSVVNWTGDNVLVVRAYHADGGSGIRGTAPWLIAKTTAVIPPTPGDVDKSGGLDVTDAVLVLKKIVNLPIDGTFDEAAADYNKSGAIDVTDAVLILKAIVGLPPG